MSATRIVTAPGVRPIMQVAIGDADVQVGQAVYDTARYDDYPAATYAGLDAQWTDDSCDVIEAVTFYGRERSVDQFDVGTATLRVANPDGLWDYPPTTIPTTQPIPGYLTPTVGYVTTPDPGPLPAQCVFVYKVRGPTGTVGTDYTVASQTVPRSFALVRRTDGYHVFFGSTAGSSTWDILFYPTEAPPSGGDDLIATAVDAGVASVKAWRHNGTAWVSGNTHTGAPFTLNDSSGTVIIGAGLEVFPGRIYSVELRTGLDPAAGTVLWRFDADDYPGGSVTAYTDPRGRTWTLTNAAAITPKVPPVPIAPLTLRPGRQLRVGVRTGPDPAPATWLWHGWIDVTAPAYDPQLGDVVDVSCVCAKGEAGRAEAAKLAAPVGDGETVTDRMSRYADVAAFPAHRRQFAASSTALVATPLGGRVGALMDRSARSAGGDVFGDRGGNLVYRSQDWQVRGPGVPPDATIGNRDLPGEICPNTWDVTFARSDFTSRVNYGQSGGTVTTVDDAAAQAMYGVETYNLTDLETVDAQIRTLLAERVLRVRNFKLAPRIAGVTLDAARPGVAAVAAAADPFAPSMYSCGHVTDDGRAVFARMMYLTGVEHTINGGAWTVRLMLDDAAPWQTNADTRYDAAHYDTDRYARAV